MKLKFKRLRPEASLPAFGHADPQNAGLDLFTPEGRVVEAYQDAWIPTGVAWEPEDTFQEVSLAGRAVIAGWKPALLIRGRSSATKIGLMVTEGTVDYGYRGEIMVHVWNPGPRIISIRSGDRIAQAVPILLPWIEVEEVDELSDSPRGTRGFGSSGA